MINEEITQKECNLAARVGSIAAAELKKALEKCLAKLDEIIKGKPPGQSKEPTELKAPTNTKQPKLKSGKQTLKQLHKHNGELSTVELKDPNLQQLYKAMKKADIDFSCVKDGKGSFDDFIANEILSKATIHKLISRVETFSDKSVKLYANFSCA